MERKASIDAAGAAALIAFAVLFAFNQVTIKVVNDGIQPIFAAGIRSAGAALCLWAWMTARGRPPRLEHAGAGLITGLVFAAEFLFLYVALDLTTVVRTSILFYTMPFWLAVGTHFLIPGERLTRVKVAGLLLAFAGVAWALVHRGGSGTASLAGDLCALGAALGWAGSALLVRTTGLVRLRPEMQLYWMVLVSAPVLLLAAPFFGPFLRDLTALHVAGLAFQIVAVAWAGFLGWLWLLGRYPASEVASFSFLSPVIGILLGWALLGESVPPGILGAGALVVAGIALVNRPARRAQVPQNVR